MQNNMTVEQMGLASILTGAIPGVEWVHGDDLCDCTFQRIGEWTNPYLGATQRIRLCCLFAKFAEQWPDLFQQIPAYYDDNSQAFKAGTADWDGEDDMPRAIWHRQIAQRTGKTLAQIREEYADQEPPKGTPRPQRDMSITINA